MNVQQIEQHQHDASDGLDEYRAEAMKDWANEAACAAREAGMEIRDGAAHFIGCKLGDRHQGFCVVI